MVGVPERERHSVEDGADECGREGEREVVLDIVLWLGKVVVGAGEGRELWLSGVVGGERGSYMTSTVTSSEHGRTSTFQIGLSGE